MLGLQVDDGLGAGSKHFAKKVLDAMARRFPCKIFSSVQEFAGVAIEMGKEILPKYLAKVDLIQAAVYENNI